MKKNDTMFVGMISITSAFIINAIALLLWRERNLGIRVPALLESTLVCLGLLLVTAILVGGLQASRKKEAAHYHQRLTSAVLEHTNYGFAILDDSNCFEVANRRFKELLSLDARSVISHNAAQVLPKSLYRFTVEYRLMPESGLQESAKQMIQFGDLYLQVCIFSIDDILGNKKYVVILQDRTDQVLMEGQLTEQLEDLQFHIEAKESLLANISHELKTPLNAITGLSHILEETPLNLKQQEIVSKLNISSDYLLSLINDVLDFSKLKKDADTLSPSYFQLADLMDSLYEMFHPLAEGKGVQLITSYSFDSTLCLHLDQVRLEQVLVNLLSNACKFTDLGSVHLKVAVLKEFQDTITLRFSVEDTGCGIDYKDLSSIFNEFYQAENHLTKSHKGTGLGLPICKHLIENMGGALWVESKKGLGSTFFCTITAPKYYGAPQETACLPETLQGHGEKVLVVEDTLINYEVVEDLLTKVNIICHHASSGLAAIERCREVGNDYYQAVLLDIHMPLMDGYEAASRLKEMGIKAPIIALTATNMDEQAKEKHAHLFSDFVLKPFKYTQLYSALHPYIEDVPVSHSNIEEVEECPYAGRDQAIENLGGDPTLYEKHLNKFKKNYATASDTLEFHLVSGHKEKARILAHSIKGLAGTLGLSYLYLSAQNLEDAICDNTQDLQPQLQTFRTKLSQVVDA